MAAAALRWLALAALVAAAQAHARFVCPMPMNGNSGNKAGPCGSGDSKQYTVVAPGPMTVRFEETVFHQGAPTAFRLFKQGDKTKSCLLLDHMPHADTWPWPVGCGFNFGSFPVGICSKSTGYVTINIPDIDCDDCVLQMVSVMTDKYSQGQFCVEKDLSVNCSTYYSCANLKILGKNRDLDACSRYEDNVPASWPYKGLTPGVYGKNEGSQDFTPAGWLSRASGADQDAAAYLPTVTPEGACAPPSARFASIFSGPDSVGVFSVIQNDVHLFVSGMSSEQLDSAWLQTSATAAAAAGTMRIPASAIIQGNSIYGAVRLAAVAQGAAAPSSLHLRLKDGRTLSADIRPAVVTVSLRDGSRHYGEVAYTADGRRAFIVGKGQESQEVKSFTLNGPSKVASSTVLENFDGLLQPVRDVLWFAGDWNMLSGAQRLSASDRKYPTAAYFWTGRAHVTLALRSTATSDAVGGGDDVVVSRRVPIPAECTPTEARCRSSIFSLAPKGGSNTGGPNVTVTATGSLVSDGGLHSFAIVLDGVRDGENVTSVEVLGSRVSYELVETAPRDDAIIVAGVIPGSINVATVDFVVNTSATSYRGSVPFSGLVGGPAVGRF